jgi:L-serine/L-threonine ammonia-lyase
MKASLPFLLTSYSFSTTAHQVSKFSNGLFTSTPLVGGSLLPNSNTKVFFKLDNLQPSGSFKDRGISHMIKTLLENGKVSKLVSSSGGNAGNAVATVGQKLGLPVDVFVPTTTMPMMIEKLKKRSANVFIGGDNWNEADAKAKEALKLDSDAKYIPPFDNPLIWDGHSSIIDELESDFCSFDQRNNNKPDAIILSVGGGGLLCGVQKGLERKGWNDVDILAVETEGVV